MFAVVDIAGQQVNVEENRKYYVPRLDNDVDAEVTFDSVLLFNDGKYVDAVNRAYYSVFHAAKSLLHSIGREVKTHSGLISEIGFYMIEKNLIEKKYGTILRRLFESRETSDYVVGAVFDEDEVKKMLKDSEDFINMAEGKTEEFLRKYR